MRKPRAFDAGIYHVAAHGSDDRHLFLADDERAAFLDGLGRIVARFELGLVEYTLLGNHYHAVLRIPDARLSKALQQLHTWYSRLHNKLHRRGAHLFKAHAFSRAIASDADLLGVSRYLAWNAVEAGLAPNPLAWPWASTRAAAGLAPPSLELDLEPLRAALGGRPDWRRRYRDFVSRAEPPRYPPATTSLTEPWSPESLVIQSR
jgi:REP element-mobilizing transposase RayT